jgi:hypothetical protein
MDEQTVNEDTLFDPSDFEVQEAEQSEDTSSPAVEVTNEEQTTSENEAGTESEVSTESKQEETQTGDAIDEFLAKKGIDRNDPQALDKMADMYRNVEKAYGQKSQEKAKLERELANAQPAQSTPDQ